MILYLTFYSDVRSRCCRLILLQPVAKKIIHKKWKQIYKQRKFFSRLEFKCKELGILPIPFFFFLDYLNSIMNFYKFCDL